MFERWYLADVQRTDETVDYPFDISVLIAEIPNKQPNETNFLIVGFSGQPLPEHF